ncbi:MAG: SRPBCC family protein [Campylobacterales bacterium]|nr:SRPBCC family protein [Campylobacterales bacterium]
MGTFTSTTVVGCSVEKLYDFHTDTQNLLKLTPPNIGIEIVNQGFVAKEGDIFSLKIIKNFIPILWKVQIQTMQRPHLLVDIALVSPFKSWRHSHQFVAISETKTELIDRVEYTMPFGIVGRLLEFFVQYELEKLFLYRQSVTKKFLEEER